MGRSKVFIVSDDINFVDRAKTFCNSQGVGYEIKTPEEWENNSPATLSLGQAPVNEGATVIPFPGAQMPRAQNTQRVHTINELESHAIEKAIFEFNGNLTEAAKALGIGRATLYRKVKQYNIDPSLARKKKAA
jgi:DNA-binding NtrC family response regulator